MDWCVLYLITISMNITAREHLNHNYSTNIRKKAETSKLFLIFFAVLVVEPFTNSHSENLCIVRNYRFGRPGVIDSNHMFSEYDNIIISNSF